MSKKRPTAARVHAHEVLPSWKRSTGGTNPADLYRWQRPGPCEKVADERRGSLLCMKCKAKIEHVPVGSRWDARDPDTGLPHMLTCAGE